jgi:hypothetical protein
MEKQRLSSAGHSAIVRIELRLHGQVLPIGQLGPDFLMLKDPVDHGPADGEILLSIDGDERRWRVRLPEGISAHERHTKIAPLNNKGASAG